jgi:hypothetical protein
MNSKTVPMFQHHTMHTYGDVKVKLNALLTSAPDGVCGSLHFTRESRLVSLDKRLGRLLSRCGSGGEDKNTTTAGNRIPIVHPVPTYFAKKDLWFSRR